MTKKRRVKAKQASFARHIKVQSVGLSISRRIDKRRGSLPEIAGGPWIEVRGTVGEALRDAHEVQLSVYVDDAEASGIEPALSIGTIIQFRPRISAVIPFPSAEFDRLWALALSGQLQYAWISLTEVYRNSARVVSVSFSNESEED